MDNHGILHDNSGIVIDNNDGTVGAMTVSMGCLVENRIMVNCRIGRYPLVMTNIAIENDHL